MIKVVSHIKQRKVADALVLPVWKDHKKPHLAAAFQESAEAINLILSSGDFQGKEGETYYFFPEETLEKRIVLLGLGEKEKVTTESLRRSYATLVKVLRKLKVESVNICLPDWKKHEKEEHYRGVCEGLLLTNYVFDLLKTESKKEDSPLIKQFNFVGCEVRFLKLFEKIHHIVSAVYMARDLIMGNADDVTPSLLCQQAKQLQKEFPKIKTTILRKKEIEREELGFLQAVSRAASVEPALIIMEYYPDPRSKQKTAIVGKGITFDTGGLNLKPTGGMEEMRSDMSGAAAVLGAMRAAASIKLKKNIIGVIPSTENAIGPDSYKPGDVYQGYAGITAEIISTDAEGRLVLVDAIAYLQEHYKPTRIIDLATLTGGAIIALGEEATAMFSNNDKLAEQLTEAGESTYERVWKMPLFSEYKEIIKSKVADIKNSGGRKASAITAAHFILHFIKDNLPWAHLDIAGTAFPAELKAYHPVQATGVGVRLLIEFLENLKS